MKMTKEFLSFSGKQKFFKAFKTSIKTQSFTFSTVTDQIKYKYVNVDIESVPEYIIDARTAVTKKFERNRFLYGTFEYAEITQELAQYGGEELDPTYEIYHDKGTEKIESALATKGVVPDKEAFSGYKPTGSSEWLKRLLAPEEIEKQKTALKKVPKEIVIKAFSATRFWDDQKKELNWELVAEIEVGFDPYNWEKCVALLKCRQTYHKLEDDIREIASTIPTDEEEQSKQVEMVVEKRNDSKRIIRDMMREMGMEDGAFILDLRNVAKYLDPLGPSPEAALKSVATAFQKRYGKAPTKRELNEMTLQGSAKSEFSLDALVGLMNPSVFPYPQLK